MKAWEETWRTTDEQLVRGDWYVNSWVTPFVHPSRGGCAGALKLAAAAPAMARALALVEWAEETPAHGMCCPCCGRGEWEGHSRYQPGNIYGAEPGTVSCELDAALTAAGLDAAAREEVRRKVER
jgi:hypothetical protein